MMGVKAEDDFRHVLNYWTVNNDNWGFFFTGNFFNALLASLDIEYTSDSL